MPPLPDVSITLGNGNLGRLAQSEDGVAGIIVSGVAVGGQFALGDVLGPFLSIKDAEAKGITRAYDITNTCLAWHHINSFFQEAGNGNPLWVMVVAKTVTLTDQALNTNAYAKKLLTAAGGKIRICGLTRVPQTGYTPTYDSGLDTDITDALGNLKDLFAEEFADHRPVRFVVEGRDWQGNAGTSLDLTDTAGVTCNVAMVVIGQDRDMAAAHAAAAKSAAVGLMLGTLARSRVHHSAGRVKSGALSIDNVGLSNGTAIQLMTTTDLNALNDKGYVFMRIITGVAGKFWNGDSMACPETDDYALMSRCRVIDKAARITYTTYVNELLDDIELDPNTGRMAVAVVKNYEAIIEAAVGTQMAGEISGVGAYVDPAQDVLSDDEVDIELNIVPRGLAKNISVALSYARSITT